MSVRRKKFLKDVSLARTALFRKRKHSSKSFDFLGFTFRPRKAKGDRGPWVLAGNQPKRKEVNQAESAKLEYLKTNSRDN